MIRLLLLLCLSLLAAMMFWGRGADEPRATATMRHAPPERAAPATNSRGITPVAYTGTESVLVPTVLPLVQPGAARTEPDPDLSESLIRYITAQSVNVREGPSTEFPVVGRLSRGEAARLLWTEENGWARITLEGDGITGFVSGEFLSAIAP
ncbi:SH3 domain-containing protein [Gemmobacter serpentinus]|uniref:SH3 domain-containing protein n=1 Tax=Gemmobacter serpentinus TaxID=2652247 RepID=UPI00124EDFA6|nr:SH3 domain-containing protein [Gemmobacter serpentinus]